MSLQLEMKIEGADRIMGMLRSLPAEVVSKRGGPVKNALRRGARVIQRQVVANLQASLNATSDEGERYSTGLLLKNVVVTRGKEPVGVRGERFLVRIRRKSYPDRGGKPVTTQRTAGFKEYGTEKQPAEPFIRPAAQQRAAEAITVATSTLLADLDKIATRLMRQVGT